MGILSHDQTLELHKAIVSAHLAGSRQALLAGVDPGFVASLPQTAAFGEQILTDLTELNSVGSLADGSIPLETWLKNALNLAGPRRESALFRRALDELLPGPGGLISGVEAGYLRPDRLRYSRRTNFCKHFK